MGVARRVAVVAIVLLAAACSGGSGGDAVSSRPDGLPPEMMGGADGPEPVHFEAEGGGEATAEADEGGQGDGADGADGAAGGEGEFFGIWRSSQQSPFGPMRVETIFMQDGKFQQESSAAGTIILIWGRFDVYEDQSHLRFTLEGWEPKEWCGPLGCEEIHYPTGESHTYRWVDEDTLMTAPRGCNGDECWVTHHKA